MSEEKNPRQILHDLATELQSQLLEDTFEVQGQQWTMRLLNEEEVSWCFSQTAFNPGNVVAMGVEFKDPTLAIGIRKMNGVVVHQVFEEDWFSLEDEEREEIINRPGMTLEKFGASCLLRYIKELPSEFANELYAHWNSLEKRRKDAQDASKKSQGESGEQETKVKDSPDSTPDGV